MSSSRSVLLLIIISLFSAFGFLAFIYFSGYGRDLLRGPEGASYKGGYAILSTDANVEDSDLTRLLETGRENFSGPPVGESSQWVMLDEFGSMQTVPLEKYSSRVSSFDPRNDGYAGKLKNVFVRDGRRYVYIPLKAGSWAVSSMNDQFKIMLSDIPFSVEYFGFGNPVSLLFVFFTVYGIAALILLVMFIAKKKSHPASLNAVVILPALSSLVFFGAGGIASCALLLGFFVMLREPLYDIIVRSKKRQGDGKKDFILNGVVKPYIFCWLALPVFAAALGIIVYGSGLNLPFVLAVFFACGILFVFSFKTASLSGGRRARFIPVLIIKRRFADFAFSVYMLPFTVAAFAALAMMSIMPGAMISDARFDHILDEQEYYAHLEYQASFSLRPLGAGSGPDHNTAVYPGYLFDKDGLPSADKTNFWNTAIDKNDYPPFPLKNMMDFFSSVNSENEFIMENADDYGESGGINRKFRHFRHDGGNVWIFALLLFLIPGFFIKKNPQGFPYTGFAGIRRFAVKPLSAAKVPAFIADKNRQKVLKCGKNNLRAQEGTFSLLARWRFRKDA